MGQLLPSYRRVQRLGPAGGDPKLQNHFVRYFDVVLRRLASLDFIREPI